MFKISSTESCVVVDLKDALKGKITDETLLKKLMKFRSSLAEEAETLCEYDVMYCNGHVESGETGYCFEPFRSYGPTARWPVYSERVPIKFVSFYPWAYKLSTKYRLTEKEIIAYLEWLMKRSPFRECIVEEPVDTVLALGMVFKASKTISTNYLVSAIFAFRYVVTHSRLISDWYRVKDILGEDAAFIFCHLYQFISRGKKATLARQNTGASYTLFYGSSISDKHLSSFLNKKKLPMKEIAFKDKTRVSATDTHYGSLSSYWMFEGREDQTPVKEWPAAGSSLTTTLGIEVILPGVFNKSVDHFLKEWKQTYVD